LLIFTGARRLKFTTATICSISEASSPHALSAAPISCFGLILVLCFLYSSRQHASRSRRQANGRACPESAPRGTCSPRLPKPFPSIPLFAMPRIAPVPMPTLCPMHTEDRKRLPFRAAVIVIAPGQGTAASGFTASTEANTRSSSKRTASRLSRSCLHVAISLSFSSGLAIPPFVFPLAFRNLMAWNTTTPMAGSSNINMKT
jgi:hypothetical protein